MATELSKKRNHVSDTDLQRKINELPPELQAEFLKATDALLQKESEIFLKLIKESRNEINGIIQGIRNDSSGGRTSAWKYEKYDDGSSAKAASNKLTQFMEKREKNKKISKINYVIDKDNEAVENYLKEVGRHKEQGSNSVPEQSIPNYARPMTSGSNTSRPGTAYKIRMDDSQPMKYSEKIENEITVTPIIVGGNYHKEKEELINKLKEQDSQGVAERERQMKLIEKKKAERQNKKGNDPGAIAANLIDQSRGATEKQLQNKLQQEKAIQEKLEKARENRGTTSNNERSTTFVELSSSSKNSIFEEGKNELSLRPKTGDDKSPLRTPESIRLQTPTKLGWSDSGSSKDIMALFEVNEQYPQLEKSTEKKQRSKKHKKKKEAETKETQNSEFLTIEDQ